MTSFVTNKIRIIFIGSIRSGQVRPLVKSVRYVYEIYLRLDQKRYCYKYDQKQFYMVLVICYLLKVIIIKTEKLKKMLFFLIKNNLILCHNSNFVL